MAAVRVLRVLSFVAKHSAFPKWLDRSSRRYIAAQTARLSLAESPKPFQPAPCILPTRTPRRSRPCSARTEYAICAVGLPVLFMPNVVGLVGLLAPSRAVFRLRRGGPGTVDLF